MKADNLKERIKKSPTTKLVLWGCILVWMFFFLLLALIMSVWAAAVLRLWLTGWVEAFLSYMVPVFIILTAMAVIFLVSRYTRSKLGMVKREKRNKDPKDNVEI